MKNKMKTIIALTITLIIVLLIISIIIIIIGKNKKDNINDTNTNSIDINIVEENKVEENNGPEENINNSNIRNVKTTDGSEIPLPEGFSYKEGTVSTGAVIEDEKGNQFVWVPTNEVGFKRKNLSNPNQKQVLETEENSIIQKSDISNDFSIFFETIESNKQYIESVNKYKGFYIARFEASIDPNDENKAKSIRGAKPLTETVYNKMRRIAKNTYSDHSSVISDLSSSYTWDTMCEWLKKSGYDIYNSTIYGNYYNNNEGTKKIATTGRNEKWCTNNIYDLAGNVWEITTEEWGSVYSTNHSGRGGGCSNDGIKYPISCRLAEYDGSYSYIGFRMVLYLK